MGILLLAGAFTQWKTGRTYGLAGKGELFRDEEPVYFAMMFVLRILLGLLSLAVGLCGAGGMPPGEA